MLSSHADQVSSDANPAPVPHRKFEFDLSYSGGDYEGVGAFVYIPVHFVESHQSDEAAFTAFTGHPAKHLISTYDDEIVSADGESMGDKETSPAEAYWAWADTGRLVPLGVCENFNEASDKSDAACPNCHWIFSRTGLREFISELRRVVPNEMNEMVSGGGKEMQ